MDVSSINDEFFKKAVAEKKKKDGEEFFAKSAEKTPLSDARKAAQAKVDKALLSKYVARCRP